MTAVAEALLQPGRSSGRLAASVLNSGDYAR
jgi:hypothetical protein